MERNCSDNGATEKAISSKVEDKAEDYVVNKQEAQSIDVERSSNSSQRKWKHLASKPMENKLNDTVSEEPIPSTIEESTPITKRSKMEQYESIIGIDENLFTSSSVNPNFDDLESSFSAERFAVAFSNIADTSYFLQRMAAVTSASAKRTVTTVKPIVSILRTITSIAETNAVTFNSADWTAVADAHRAAADHYVKLMDAMTAAADALAVPSHLPVFSHRQ